MKRAASLKVMTREGCKKSAKTKVKPGQGDKGDQAKKKAMSKKAAPNKKSSSKKLDRIKKRNEMISYFEIISMSFLLMQHSDQ